VPWEDRGGESGTGEAVAGYVSGTTEKRERGGAVWDCRELRVHFGMWGGLGRGGQERKHAVGGRHIVKALNVKLQP
jgi:hypothetical protein